MDDGDDLNRYVARGRKTVKDCNTLRDAIRGTA